MDNSNMFLTSEAVAVILMVSKRTLQNYRAEGKLKYYKLSRKTIRYRVEDVVEFLKQSSCCSSKKDRIDTLLEKYVVKLQLNYIQADFYIFAEHNFKAFTVEIFNMNKIPLKAFCYRESAYEYVALLVYPTNRKWGKYFYTCINV